MAKDLEKALVEEGLLTPEQLQEATKLLERSKKSLEDVLVDAGYVEEETLVAFLAKLYKIPYVNLYDQSVDPRTVTLVPEPVTRKHRVIPVKHKEGELYVASRDPFNFVAFDEIQSHTGCVVRPVMASTSGIQKRLYEYRDHFRVKEVSELLKGESWENFQFSVDAAEDKEAATKGPIVKLVNLMLMEALRRRASDIHVQPEEDSVKIRFRVDGMLQEGKVLPLHALPPLVSRIKIMAEMDIAEKRLPQDGQFSFRLKDRIMDVRVSSLPTVSGEKVVLRILDKTSLILGMDFIGFPHDVTVKLRRLIHRPHGIIIVTGPTGSGKTTTLYSMLQTIHTPEKNITTVENPVEYRLPGISQVQTKSSIGLTFASALRSILRQDPDVLLIGEIRDLETTEIAIRASLTGHLVLATLHTNDAAAAVARLIDMGAEPYLLATSLKAVVAQRLVRTLCRFCKEEVAVPPSLKERYGLSVAKVFQAKGCPTCFQTGYHGRKALGELLEITPAIQDLILDKLPSRRIYEEALKEGMVPMRRAGLQDVERGVTTLEEVLRVTDEP